MKSKKEKLVEEAKKKKVTDATITKDTNNKQGFLIIGIALLILIFSGIYFAAQYNKTSDKYNTDGEKFEKEYETLNCNGKKDCEYLEVSIDSNNPIVYSNYEEIFELLKDGTGIVYFGFPECPWCRNLVPVLLEAAEEVGVNKIYYLNNVTDRDKIEVNEKGELETTKEGSKDYAKLLEKLGEFASNYTLKTEDNKVIQTGKKRLYFPTVVSIKNGEIVGFHEATLDSQTDPKIELTKEQKQELKEYLAGDMLAAITCSEDGKC